MAQGQGDGVNDLLPCPFCNAKAHLRFGSDSSKAQAACDSCGAGFGPLPLFAAKEAWNRRTGPTTPRLDPVAYVTKESLRRLREAGGNHSRGTVPIHRSRSSVASIPMYCEATKEKDRR